MNLKAFNQSSQMSNVSLFEKLSGSGDVLLTVPNKEMQLLLNDECREILFVQNTMQPDCIKMAISKLLGYCMNFFSSRILTDAFLQDWNFIRLCPSKVTSGHAK
jgi:hypothetical protein